MDFLTLFVIVALLILLLILLLTLLAANSDLGEKAHFYESQCDSWLRDNERLQQKLEEEKNFARQAWALNADLRQRNEYLRDAVQKGGELLLAAYQMRAENARLVRHRDGHGRFVKTLAE